MAKMSHHREGVVHWYTCRIERTSKVSLGSIQDVAARNEERRT